MPVCRPVRADKGPWILLLAVLALLALVPAYPVDTVDYLGWFGPPGANFRYENGTTFHPLVEVVGGGFAWRTTWGRCITDVGGWVQYRASPIFLAAFLPVAAGLMLLLMHALFTARTERSRAARIGTLGALLVVLSTAWLVWYGVSWAVCPADVGPATAFAAALTAGCLATGLVLVGSRATVARLPWPRVRFR